MILFTLCLFGGALTGWVVAGLVRRQALRQGLLDHPNARSSHTEPTPRGGGLGIVLAMELGIVVAALAGWLPHRLAFGIGIGVALVGGIGWLDDRRGLPARLRAVVHLVAAAIAVAAIGVPMTPGGWLLAALAVLWIGWCVNLYNFMDGIDGLAGVEAVTAGVTGGTMLWLSGAPGLAVIGCTTAVASLGFLGWNWPPARIFMGDVASGALGFLFGVLAVAGQVHHGVPLPLWFLLLGVFLLDATVTLFRRMTTGQRWYSAHRSHAYQRLVQSGWSHREVTTAVLALNLILGGMALLAWQRPSLLWPMLALGSAMVGLAYIWVERRQPFLSPTIAP